MAQLQEEIKPERPAAALQLKKSPHFPSIPWGQRGRGAGGQAVCRMWLGGFSKASWVSPDFGEHSGWGRGMVERSLQKSP